MVGCIWAFHQWKWMCGGHGVFSAWSSLRTTLNRVGESKHPWWTPTVVLKNSPNWLFKRMHCWSSHIVPEWLEPVLTLCWSFCRPATGLHARLSNAFLKSPKLGISSELLKNGGKKKATVLAAMCQKIWKTKEWPKEWTQTLIIPLLKIYNL